MQCNHITPSPSFFCKDCRLTLLCILNCAAYLLPEAEDLVASFLTQTIKVFTKVSTNAVYVDSVEMWT